MSRIDRQGRHGRENLGLEVSIDLTPFRRSQIGNVEKMDVHTRPVRQHAGGHDRSRNDEQIDFATDRGQAVGGRKPVAAARWVTPAIHLPPKSGDTNRLKKLVQVELKIERNYSPARAAERADHRFVKERAALTASQLQLAIEKTVNVLIATSIHDHFVRGRGVGERLRPGEFMSVTDQVQQTSGVFSTERRTLTGRSRNPPSPISSSKPALRALGLDHFAITGI